MRQIHRAALRPQQGAAEFRPCVLQAGYFQGDPEHGTSREGLEEHILISCVSGQGKIQTRGESAMTAGDVVLIPGGQSHAYAASPQDPWSIYWMHFTDQGGGFSRMFLRRADAHGVLALGVQAKLVELFEELLQALDQPMEPMSRQRADALAQLALCEILRGGGDAFAQVVGYMRAHITEKLSLDVLARQARLSKYHFSRAFQAAYQMPPMQYFNRMKILHACELLTHAHSSVAEISEQLGYSTPYYFSEQFKEITGMAPGRYRRAFSRGRP